MSAPRDAMAEWPMLKRTIERGNQEFDFGRSTKGSSSEKFKLQWGGQSYPSYWQRAKLQRDRIAGEFVQENISFSRASVVRGLHYQLNRPQGKSVRVTSGAVFDVALDVRAQSETLGQYVAVELNDTNQRAIYIPPGFAHGFCVLSDEAHVVYSCTDYYDPESERTVVWNDPDLKMPWPVQQPVLSTKDANGVAFAEVELFPW